MRINHNLAAMTTRNSLFTVNREMSKSIQKLSTGLRINSAADDAAGLGVSENLRTQVRGMSQAMKNTQDAIALLNIADGALNEQASILQRMRELTIQAKNDTYTQTEREYMGQEFGQLVKELDRIAAVTTYNGMRLFAAPEEKYGTTIFTISRPQLQPHETGDQSDIFGAGNEADSVFGANDLSSSHHFNMMIGGNYEQEDIDAFYAARESYLSTSSNMLTIQLGQMDANGLLNKGASGWTNAQSIYNFSWDPVNDWEDDAINFALGGNATVQDKLDIILKVIDGKSIDPTVADFLFAFGGANSNTTGLEKVNTMRSTIGALINRLESTTNNLANQITNTQSAESLIRDTDFAAETVTFTQRQILTNSATAMLAQANTTPNSILQLLQ
jgi:flagellin